MMKRILIISLLALLMFACGGNPKDKATLETVENTTEKVTEKAKNVRVMTLEEKTIDIQQEYTAGINAFDKVYLAPTMPGRIVDVRVEVTDKVLKDQLVVLMDDAQLLQLKVQYENLKKEMERMDTLIAYGSISEQIYDQTEAQYIATKSSYENMLENTKLLAPFNGIVTGRYFEDNEIYNGQPNTQAGKAAIVTIEHIEKLKVKVNMSARYFPLVKNGLEATLKTDIYPGKEFKGKVSLVYPTIDPQTRTFTVEITFPNKDLTLRPGMYAKVKVKLDEKEALVVPASTVMMQEGTANRFIFILDGDKAKRVAVELGERFDDKLEIISEENLVGQQVIIAGQSKLENGDLVAVQ